MKKFEAMLILAALLLCINAIHAQTPNFLWARQTGGAGEAAGLDVAVDGFDNGIVTGWFTGTATFGDTVLTSAGDRDIFIASYDKTGHLLWVRRAGGAGDDESYGVAVDGSNNSFITGWFQGTAAFGDTTLTGIGAYDIFLAKYGENGHFLWVRQAGGVGLNSGTAAAVDDAGNVVVTGFFQGTVSIGDTTLISSPAGGTGMFVAGYDASGEFLWTRAAVGNETGLNQGWGIAIDGLGNSLVTGTIEGTATFDHTTLTSLSDLDVFIAKYDEVGDLQWVRQAGGGGYELASGLATDSFGNSFVTGCFSSTTVIFGDTIILSNFGEDDIFIAKYDENGQLLWVQQAGGTGTDEGLAIATDSDGNAVVTGIFRSTATFGDTILTATGSENLFVAKFDARGDLVWIQQAGGGFFATRAGVAVDGFDNSVLTGSFQNKATFGETSLTSAGESDIFITQVGNDRTTGIEPAPRLPVSFHLLQNHPNPFNPTTVISYQLSAVSDVELTIYNQLGQEVRTLVNERKPAGTYQIQWDGRDKSGKQVSSGVYLYRLKAGSYVETRKMVLLR